MCSDALDDEPECLDLLLIRARARMALRRDLDAQADLRDVIRLDPQCGLAYRLLGELAARRDENGPAAVFFREALRLDPSDREADDWLVIVEAVIPAPATRRVPSTGQPRLARGTQPVSPDLERPTKPFAPRQAAAPPAAWSRAMAAAPTPQPGTFARGSDRDVQTWKAGAYHIPVEPAPVAAPRATLTGHPPIQPPARPAPRAATRSRGPTPELPGFGEYLVTAGILTRERLRAAEAYQRSMRVQLSTAIVTLGLATPQRIEWAAVAHQSQLARQRQAP